MTDDGFRFGADGDSSFQVLWRDSERVFCRERRLDAGGDWNAVFVVLLAWGP